ncbi:hypothetical protein B0T17DRAFT_136823 [Bombardia bombarda]|uniref:Tim44-like domain-containing protein n=1 Tax=Bombardia bombarda TaxID=252184 RepID=A0AA39T0G6_9PEZI|nr:hypothetical protein B0T17DRAFT_136823 [Bombardia bombarda]
MAASRLGLRGGARDMWMRSPSATTSMAAPRVVPAASAPSSSRPLSTTPPRCAKAPAKRREKTPSLFTASQQRLDNRTAAPSVDQIRDRGRRAGQALSSADVAMLLPQTFVAPPYAQFPGGRKFFGFLRNLTKVKFFDLLQRVLMVWASKPTILRPARFRPKSALALATARALHRSMAEAVAAGDLATLRKVCVNELYFPLVSQIEKRPKGRRYGWELVKYNNTWRYPRVISDKIAIMGTDTDSPIVRQVDLEENIVLTCSINPSTWEQDDWRIFGTVKHTSLEGWEAEKKLLDRLQEEDKQKTKAEYDL